MNLDKTFCSWGPLCQGWLECDRVMTLDVIDEARKFDRPLSQCAFKECFVPFFEGVKCEKKG